MGFKRQLGQLKQQVSRLVWKGGLRQKAKSGCIGDFTKSLIVNAMSKIALNKGRGGTVNEMLKAPTSLSLQR